MKQLIYILFVTAIQVRFHLWQKKHFAKYQEVPKYYDHVCSPNLVNFYTNICIG